MAVVNVKAAKEYRKTKLAFEKASVDITKYPKNFYVCVTSKTLVNENIGPLKDDNDGGIITDPSDLGICLSSFCSMFMDEMMISQK